MTKKLKEEYQPGGSKRHEIMDKSCYVPEGPTFRAASRQEIFLAGTGRANNARVSGGPEQSIGWGCERK
jgi:hypothetical protein